MRKVTSAVKLLFTITAILLIQTSCKKDLRNGSEKPEDLPLPGTTISGHLKQTKTFSSEVATRWLNMQLDLLRVPMAQGVGSQAADRCLAYCGIALYESVVAGMPAYQSLYGQLNQFPEMPATQPGLSYHWAAAANAALAYMNRNLFPAASSANIILINDLENELEAEYATQVNSATLQRSIDHGRLVAQAVFNWAQTDGTLSMPAPGSYTIPVGAGLWEKTPPNFAGPVTPFLGMRRQLVPGSEVGSSPVLPPAYSTDPASAFYAMAKDVYDRSQALTSEQTALALYSRDAPGYPGGGSLVPILSQVIQTSGCGLDMAALAYAKLGIGIFDASTLVFIQKYTTNLVRPITYIRNVMGYTTWSPLFPTPGHPEFPAAHANSGGVISAMLTSVFGENFSLTLDYYNYLGLPARTYHSLDAIGMDMGNSRVYGGIHYQHSVDQGFFMGKKISENILAKLNFKK